jgi:NAD-dependent deacetylase sirtuin 5
MTSSDIDAFQSKLRSARKIAVLTGAGISAESGVPTFRDPGGLWQRYDHTRLASVEAWEQDPGLVWAFHDHLRRLVHTCAPNPAHRALAVLETRWQEKGGTFTLLTQNIDGLHEAAGSRGVVRLHGSAWQVRCVACGEVVENRDMPITAAFEGSGAPDPDAAARRFTEAELPHCPCGGVQRPHVVWFGEMVESRSLVASADAIDHCQLMIVVGTSAVVYPAAGLVPLAKRYGTIIAEVNVEPSGVSDLCDFSFAGKAGELLPSLLDVTPVCS